MAVIRRTTTEWVLRDWDGGQEKQNTRAALEVAAVHASRWAIMWQPQQAGLPGSQNLVRRRHVCCGHCPLAPTRAAALFASLDGVVQHKPWPPQYP